MKKQISNPFILALKAHNLTVEIHRHSAYQIVLSNDIPFTSTIGGKRYEGIHGFLIKPQVPHFCVAEKGSLNVLNIEPYSYLGWSLSIRFHTADDPVIFYTADQINDFFRKGSDTFDIVAISNAWRDNLIFSCSSDVNFFTGLLFCSAASCNAASFET